MPLAGAKFDANWENAYIVHAIEAVTVGSGAESLAPLPFCM